MRHPPCPPGFPKLAAVCSEGRGLVSDVDHSLAATPHGTGFLDESSANCGDSICSSVSGLPLGDKGLANSPHYSENNYMMASLPTDNKVSKYSFYSCLSHYMEGNKIGESNCASVEICILSEAGAFVHNMDPMKKDKKEKAFFAKYVSIIDEIEDMEFKNELIRSNMHQRYKGAKKNNNGQSQWQKYKTKLIGLRSFSQKNPGMGNLAELPSGSTKLRHMKKPLVQDLWTAKHLV